MKMFAAWQRSRKRVKIIQKQIDYRQFRNQNLAALIPIVKKWLDFNELYLKKTRGERPSLYNERPLIGMLGAAAYATGSATRSPCTRP